ncbi:hypothetical protein VTL71DRAFT_14729 [Oculimacula yallundae]|uniref:Protein kinase domain-containing protein n=1 Tax=Oculimacula yallundae TaxID=86028 RepID=A0ABR4CJU6_9HELO
MGPELSLAVVGVVLAGPGVAILFRDFGAHVIKQIQTIKNAPDLIIELQEIGRAVCEGKLRSCIDIAEHSFGLEDLDPALHADLVRGLDQMREELLKVDTLLGKLVDENGSISRAKLMLPPRWTWRIDAKRILMSFNKIQQNFQLTITIAEARHRSLSTPEPLTLTKFRPRLNVDGSLDCHVLEENSHLWQVSAEIRDERGQPNSTRVFIEKTDVTDAGIPKIAGHLIKNMQDSGILKCLGYHQDGGQPYLVFELPEGFDNASTLRQTILRTPLEDQGPGGGHTLEDRMRLAHLISESLLFVHNAELVHKNIRLDTILLLRAGLGTSLDKTRSLVSAKPYLTYWTMMRRMTDLSSRRGNLSWLRGIYQHPHRQGLQPQTRYNIGHDIYSLGVCLLEIGLWQTITVAKSETDALLVDVNDSYDISEQTMSEVYRNMALSQQLISSDDIDSIDVLTETSTVTKVLVALAQHALPQRVGSEYSNVVLACLTCLEGGLGEEVSVLDFSKNATAVALRFKLVVVEALANMPNQLNFRLGP